MISVETTEISNRLVRILARKFSHQLDEEDLVQEGMLAYIRAMSTFKPETGVQFDTYASRVITNRFIDILRKKGDAVAELKEDVTIGNISFDDQINLIEIKNVLEDKVNDIERAIFNSYIQGFSYDEMSKIFSRPRKQIDNIVQKVKKIVKTNVT